MTRDAGPADLPGLQHALGERAAAQDAARLVSDNQGPSTGFALWLDGPRDQPAQLGLVSHKSGYGKPFYQLVEHCARAALAAGHTEATFDITSERLLKKLERDFRIDATPSAWAPNSGAELQWTITVNLRDALAQLQPHTT